MESAQRRGGVIDELAKPKMVGPDFTGPSTTGDMMDAGYGGMFRLSM
jgi:hypothetical protein